MNPKDLEYLRKFQEENCITHSCKFADPKTVGTGKPCCTYPGRKSVDQDGNCESWQKEVKMYCLKCGKEWVARTYKEGTQITTELYGYCGCGTKLQRKKVEGEWHTPLSSVEGLIQGIEQDYLPYTIVEADGKPAESKEEALQWLQGCEDRGITAI